MATRKFRELEKPERLDGVGLFTVLDLELK